MRALIGSIAFLVGAAAAPAYAATVEAAPPCSDPLDMTVTMLESRGAHLVDLVDVKSKVFDQLAVFVYQGIETMGMVKNDCMVGEPIIIGAEP